jgi:ABC-2 type transport system ATP-binding protein
MSIEIRDLVVRYAGHTAVDGLSLSVPEGSCFGLLGPNGAGKSSTIRCIATVQAATSGMITVGGHDVAKAPDAVRALLGVVPQGLAVYDGLSVAQNLRIFGGLYGLPSSLLSQRIAWGLELSQLGPHRDKKAGELSGGMKRRLNIAAALLHDPKILIFDEPTTGVDPQSRNHIFETIRALHREGRTVVYTTHYMEEVEALCERVAIVDAGRVVACDTLDALLRRATPTAFRVRPAAPIDAASLRARLAAAGLDGEVEAEGQTLEAVFLEVTGRALRDAS